MTDVWMYEKLLVRICIKVLDLQTKMYFAIQSVFIFSMQSFPIPSFLSATFYRQKPSIIAVWQPFFQISRIHHGRASHWQLDSICLPALTHSVSYNTTDLFDLICNNHCYTSMAGLPNLLALELYLFKLAIFSLANSKMTSKRHQATAPTRNHNT